MRGGNSLIGIGTVLAMVASAFALVFPNLGFAVTFVGVDVTLAFSIVALAGFGIALYGAWLQFGPRPRGQKRAHTDALLIYRSMIALAGIDGELHPEELLMIQRCCRQFFQRDMSHTEIRKAFDHHGRVNYAGFAFDGADQRASPEACVWAYTAALMVAKADGVLSEAEDGKLDQLAALLGLDQDARTRAAEEAARL